MNNFITGARQTLIPDQKGRDGPFPPLLVTMTFVTGLVDAFSYLVLGHVFVANMTGNVVFLGFALAGAPSFSIGASLVALVSFWFGALVAGRTGKRFEEHRARVLIAAVAMQVCLLGISVILAELSGSPAASGYRYPLIVLLAVSMGAQNAAVRQIAVPDLTTTVLTMTLTGIGADSSIGGGKGSKSARRLISIVAMVLGALVGAVFVVHIDAADALIIALVVLAIIGVIARTLVRSDAAWTKK